MTKRHVASVSGSILVFAVVVGVGALLASAQSSAPQRGSATEIFCEGLGLGQLCLQDAPNVLRLSDTQTKSWREAALRYNRAVGTATEQLMEDSRAILTPAQLATLERWFDQGLNPILNQAILSAPRE